ncbi:CitMHS family transporter [Pseudoroseomonas cervicalis]|uniref:CitMHS family transporter n=1 Tax=Teichococcus cervicalis TaxID=204525 RepID=UPI002781A26D|nr:CitMHS family transporter [Pseudoroseomonas cervicalis]MDQ1080055.1 CitMHS family citrate-Mg2+:H+ or citrate-Ca2+:H+ symporter [Pseudoroseomonas cervicalis]
MLTFLAYLMVVVFMTLIMTGRLPALLSLILVPTAFALLAGFGGSMGPMMLEGIRSLAPTGVMLLFAILYFGIMIDAGLFDPVARTVLRFVKGDPVRIVIGTAVLAMIVSLDGDSATSYLITTTAMLPLYRRLGMNPLIAACVIMLAAGNTNLTPWGGPTARAASALHLDPNALFVPLVPSMIACALTTIGIAWLLGRRERARIGIASLDRLDDVPAPAGGLVDTHDPAPPERRPHLLWVNLALTLALMASLLLGLLPLPALFMIAFAIAMVINYPKMEDQKARIAAHAPNVLAVVSLIFAAGIFTGILSGTGMVEAMAQSVLAIIPEGAGRYIPLITAIVSVPFTFFISNDAFYFGILPVLAQAAAAHGIPLEAIGRASLVGQQVHLLSPLVASTYLLVGLCNVDFGAHQRFTLPWSLLLAVVMLGVSALLGVIPVF